MPRPSTIDTLAPELRAEIDRLLGDKRFTLADIVGHMQKLGADLSKSAVHRARKKYEDVAARMREAREIASAVSTELGGIAEDEVGRFLTELLRTITFNVIMGKSEQGEEATPMDVMLLARALKDIEGALRTSEQTKAAARKELAAQVAKKAAAAAEQVDQVVRERGLSAEAAAAIRAHILGVRIDEDAA